MVNKERSETQQSKELFKFCGVYFGMGIEVNLILGYIVLNFPRVLLSVIFGFCILSYILHHNPLLLHKHASAKYRQKKRVDRTKIKEKDSVNTEVIQDDKNKVNHWPDPRLAIKNIAHRGSKEENYPENTLIAFKHALDVGTDLLEFDVWLTKDEKIVIFHDETLERMTGKAGKITDFVYDELPYIPISEKCPVYKDYKKDSYQIQMPLLEDILTLLKDHPNVFMDIEFKHDSQLLIDKVHEQLQKFQIKERVIWFSLKQNLNIKLRIKDPSIPNITSVLGMLKILLMYYSGVLPFMSIEEDIYGVPCDKVDFTRLRSQALFKGFPDSFIYFMLYLFGGHPPKALLPHGLFQHLRKRGIPIWLLGVNSHSDLEVAVKAGVTAVLTDKPEWLSENKNRLLDLPSI